MKRILNHDGMKPLQQYLAFGVVSLTLGLSACATTQSPDQLRAGQNADNPKLFGTAWVVTELNGLPQVSANEARNIPSLQLDKKNKRFSGADGCNRIMGTYTVKGKQLSFGPIASTMMACVDSNDTELAKNYTESLGKVASYQLQGKALSLLDSSGNPIIQLSSTIQPR